MKEDDLLEKVKNLQDDYYKENKKNTFFKKAQKYECAKTVSTNLDVITLLKNTMYFLPNSTDLYFHYPLFKTFANPENFETIVMYFVNLCKKFLEEVGTFNLHINWVGYTISAHQRYMPLYDLFIKLGRANNFALEYSLKNLYLYNPPNVLDQIEVLIRPIIAPGIQKKIKIISKSESQKHLTNLFNSFNK
tara:strand:- start:2159 stop:2731 length:573 start_codon:yes stop_codon:yes gene_type:complete